MGLHGPNGAQSNTNGLILLDSKEKRELYCIVCFIDCTFAQNHTEYIIFYQKRKNIRT